jgi:hypothetical protein
MQAEKVELKAEGGGGEEGRRGKERCRILSGNCRAGVVDSWVET